ncbi:Mediator of RNA polymerase II transcription subunit 16 [Ancistrocladus abbreviatus]
MVAGSFSCSRRAVLDERLKCSEQSTAALVGSLLHQIFQAGLLLEIPTEDLLYEYSRIVLNKNVENLYACGVNENEVFVTLAGAIPRIINWIKLFKHSQNSNVPVVDFGLGHGLKQIFGNPTSSFGGQAPMQTVWEPKVNKSIPPTNDFKAHQAVAGGPNADSSAEKAKRVTFDPFDMPSDVRILARILYSAHGGEVAVAFLRGGVHIFSGPSFAPVDNYQITVGSAIAAPAFSSTSCCSASVWHDSCKDCTILKIIHVLPPALASNQAKANSSTWERAIAERFWWSLLVGVDWWDAVGCTQSAAEDGIGEDMQVSFSAEGIRMYTRKMTDFAGLDHLSATIY